MTSKATPSEKCSALYDSKKDYLDKNKARKHQRFACVSILGPDTERNKYDERLIKIRGVFKNQHKAFQHAVKLAKKLKGGNVVDIYTAPVGEWCPCYCKEPQDKWIPKLNRLMFDTIVGQVRLKMEYEQRKKDLLAKKVDPAEGVYKESKVEIEMDADAPEEDKEKEAAAAPEEEDAVKTAEVSAPIEEEEEETVTYSHMGRDPEMKSQKWTCISFLKPFEGTVQGVHGFKIHGSFETEKEANEYVKGFRKVNRVVHTYLAPMGQWVRWNPEKDDVEKNVFEQESLNQLFGDKKEAAEGASMLVEDDKQDDVENDIENLLSNNAEEARADAREEDGASKE